jgi:hypothetical protein
VFFLFPGCVFNSLGSEQTKIYRAKILLCCGAIRVDTKFEIQMSTFFLGGRAWSDYPWRQGNWISFQCWLKSNRCTIAGIAVCVDKAVPLA